MIYVHVPFCKKFCTYCDFYSEIAEEGCFKAYGDGVCAEIRQRAKDMDDDPRTLYFGGGTPSVLPLSVLTRILITLDEVGHGGPYREFTMEVNPEDIVEKGKGYVESLLSLGVNRLSIGVQSFDDRMLQWMNRRHDAAGAKEAFRLAREAGAENISLDLIFGITHLDDAVWADTIDQAIALGPEHISCYQLSVEGESALAEMVAEGRYTEADDTLCRRQYDMLCQKLGAAGYHHYEISNFAKEGFEAVHNGGYWERRPYVGIGPGAHSFRGMPARGTARSSGAGSPRRRSSPPRIPSSKPSCCPCGLTRASTRTSCTEIAARKISDDSWKPEPWSARATVTGSPRTTSSFPTRSSAN